MQEVSVNEIVQDALATVQSEIDVKKLVLKLELTSANVTLTGDEMRLQQVFWNVLKNAIKFTPKGGQISVTTKADPARGLVVVEVADTGAGISPDEMARVFEPFRQGDHAGVGGSHKFGGLGLGLAISRSLLHLHAGTIRASSGGIGLGCLFTIELPVTLASPAAPPRPHGPDARFVNPSGNQLRILVVEDHAPTRISMLRILTTRKCAVFGAESMAEARRLASEHTFDLLITDVGLPDGNGFDLLEELSRTRKMKGIAVSGYGADSDIERSRRAGYSVHLVKPVGIRTLEDALSVASDPAAPFFVHSNRLP
jgi:CheY-like chemotaxis protein